MLKWIPLPLDGSLKSLGVRETGSIQPPAGLEDFQVGWYWNLFWTALRNPEHPGFLASRKNLWTFAGAHRRAHWDANCALVMAAFELREIAEQKLWCLPPLVAIVEEQRKKLRDKKARGGIFHNIHSVPQTVGGLSPPLQSGFAFDLEDPIQIQKPSNTRARTRSPELTTPGYTQADFDERDIRKMAKAWDWLCERNGEGTPRGHGLSPRQMFEQVCDRAGLSIERGLELEQRRKKWPEKVPEWLREEASGS